MADTLCSCAVLTFSNLYDEGFGGLEQCSDILKGDFLINRPDTSFKAVKFLLEYF